MIFLQNDIIKNSDDLDHDGDAVIELEKPKLKRPPLYRVILLNDDYTPMEFVVHLLTGIFSMSEEQAVQVMLEVHEKGAGVCGVFTREIAETKVEHVMSLAVENQHPLQCTMEPDEDDEGE